MMVERSLKGVQMAEMMAEVILTKTRLESTTPTARTHTANSMGTKSEPNPPSSGESLMRSATMEASAHAALMKNSKHCWGAERSMVDTPLSLSGCTSACMRSSRTTSRPNDEMVRMKPMVLSSTWPALMSTPPMETTMAAAMEDHLNLAEPTAMESAVTPTGSREPVMA